MPAPAIGAHVGGVSVLIPEVRRQTRRRRQWRILIAGAATVFLGLIAAGIARTDGPSPHSLQLAPGNVAAAAACNSFYQEGVIAARAKDPSVRIVLQMAGTYATTAAGEEKWEADMPNGGSPAPPAIRKLDPSTPLSVCYFQDPPGTASGLSSPDPRAPGIQTEVLAITPSGKVIPIVFAPLHPEFSPPPNVR